MAVDPQHTAGTLLHDGREYHFCSLQCARKFADAPARYADAAEAGVSPGALRETNESSRKPL